MQVILSQIVMGFDICIAVIYGKIYQVIAQKRGNILFITRRMLKCFT